MSIHKSVLLQELIEGLQIRRGEVVLDATINGGGMSFEVAQRYPGVKIVGIDADKYALEQLHEEILKRKYPIETWEGNFRDLDQALQSFGIQKVDRIILDLGLSSNQLETSGRGFTFLKDEPLLMTYSSDPKLGDLTALEVVNSWDKEDLRRIFSEYGEERFAGRIAEAIVEGRPIRRTSELVEVIRKAVPIPYAKGRIHPATRTFQALRIAVNDELTTLSEGLKKGFAALTSGGRMAVISFQSLEDRIVKHFMKDKALQGLGELITKKPIVATETEIKENPRSRSAKLRIIQKF